MRSSWHWAATVVRCFQQKVSKVRPRSRANSRALSYSMPSSQGPPRAAGTPDSETRCSRLHPMEVLDAYLGPRNPFLSLAAMALGTWIHGNSCRVLLHLKSGDCVFEITPEVKCASVKGSTRNSMLKYTRTVSRISSLLAERTGLDLHRSSWSIARCARMHYTARIGHYYHCARWKRYSLSHRPPASTFLAEKGIVHGARSIRCLEIILPPLGEDLNQLQPSLQHPPRTRRLESSPRWHQLLLEPPQTNGQIIVRFLPLRWSLPRISTVAEVHY